MKRVLLTGATGFVGRNLCLLLEGAPYVVRAALRGPHTEPAGVAEAAVVGDITSQTDWRAALEGVDIVIHAAARAHRVNDTAEEPYFEVNARGTLCLARAALRAGVTRFIYLSTIKVNGEGGAIGHTRRPTSRIRVMRTARQSGSVSNGLWVVAANSPMQASWSAHRWCMGRACAPTFCDYCTGSIMSDCCRSAPSTTRAVW